MPDLNFDEIRKKPADDLTTDDELAITENWDKLNEEEKGAFAYLKPEEKEEEKKEEKKEEEKKEEPFTFKSEEDFNAAVETGVQKTLEAREKARQEAEEEEKRKKEGKLPERIFPEKYTAPEWEEPARKIIDRAKEEIRREDTERNEEVRGRITAINQEFDNQTAEIRKNNPDLPAKGTPEGDEFERELAEIGTKFKGVTDMNEAFDIWTAKQGKEVDEGKIKLAKKISGGSGTGEKGKELPYSRLRKGMDTLLEERKAEEGIE